MHVALSAHMCDIFVHADKYIVCGVHTRVLASIYVWCVLSAFVSVHRQPSCLSLLVCKSWGVVPGTHTHWAEIECLSLPAESPTT